jgi:trans-AT polyketide synthase, acyltransferase and oxidoreductase domains
MTFSSPSLIGDFISFNGTPANQLGWKGPVSSLVFEEAQLRQALLASDKPLWAVSHQHRIGLTNEGSTFFLNDGVSQLIAYAPALAIDQLGDPSFKSTYNVRYACYAGAMANGISSEQLVIALGKAGILASFGAAGLSPARVEASIQKIQAALPDGPYAFNLINTPNETALEGKIVDLYLKYKVNVIEASAYLSITSGLVRYRAAGLTLDAEGKIVIHNRIIVKLSRLELAKRFLSPAPADVLKTLVLEGKISELQARLAEQVPMVDDITMEADSAGHTDNRPLVCLIPACLSLRDELKAKFQYTQQVRIGAAGGIGTPEAALAAFTMGAAFIVTGSVNQGCIESGTSDYTRNLLAKADMADVGMAPAADMFEMGVKVQVLKRGSMFAMRGLKLFELYSRYDSIETIPLAEREKLETQVFKKSLDDIWNETVNFFMERDPAQIARGNANPKDKMALVFRWYLGLSSRWANSGEKGREMDYQIWCGPSMGAFNYWTRGTYLAEAANRKVVDVTFQLLTGCAYLNRVRLLNSQGISFSNHLERYVPTQPMV